MSLAKPIYLDYHASTPIDRRVAVAMAPYIDDLFANPHSSEHSAGWLAQSAVEAASEKIALALGLDPDEVIFTSGATEANNLAILGLARRAPPSRRRILIGAIEHKSVIASAQAAEALGFGVERVPVDGDGVVRLEALAEQLRDDVLLVSVQAVNSEIGTIQPIESVVAQSHAVGALVHCDAAQALAARTISLRDVEVDLMSLSGHKIYGPKGIGALLVRREIQEAVEPIIYGGGQQGGLRSGTLPVQLCVGLAEAISVMTGPEAEAERKRLRDLRDLLLEELFKVNGEIRLNGPALAIRHPGNANLQFPGFDGRDVLASTQPNLAASTGSACASGSIEPSPVLLAIGLSRSEAESSVRFCVGRFTQAPEILATAVLISAALGRLRS